MESLSAAPCAQLLYFADLPRSLVEDHVCVMAARRALPVPSPPASPRRSRGRSREGTSFPVAPPATELPGGYAAFLADLKRRVERERLRVVVAANSALVLLYWDLGKAILD